MPDWSETPRTCEEAERGLRAPLGNEFRTFRGCHQSWLRSRGAQAQAKIRELRGQIRELEWNTHPENRPAARKKAADLRDRLRRWEAYHDTVGLLYLQSRYRVSILRVKVKERPHRLSNGFFVSRGQVLDVLEENRSWYKVRTVGGRVGYLEKGSAVLGKPLEVNSRTGRPAGRQDTPGMEAGRG